MMMSARPVAVIACALALLALPAGAQTPAAPGPAAPGTAAPPAGTDAHAPHAVPHAEAPSPRPATANEAFAAAMDRMHKGMMVVPTGDADVDFVRGMIPHHQGAIDMARIELEFGNDPDLRRLSEQIIKDQQAEITRMQAWLDARAPETASAATVTDAPPAPKPAN